MWASKGYVSEVGVKGSVSHENARGQWNPKPHFYHGRHIKCVFQKGVAHGKTDPGCLEDEDLGNLKCAKADLRQPHEG